MRSEMTRADKRMNPVNFGSDPADIRNSGLIRKSGFEYRVRVWPCGIWALWMLLCNHGSKQGQIWVIAG